MTSSELLKLRNETYRPPEVPVKCCMCCVRFSQYTRDCEMMNGNLHNVKDVDPLGICDAFESK